MKTTNINPLSGFQLPDRETQIEICVAKSRRPMPDIAVSFMMENIHTGQRHSLFGMPFNFRSEDYKRVDLGFAWQDKNGTKYGTLATTREELIARFEKSANKTADDFKALLQAMTASELESQFRYWEK